MEDEKSRAQELLELEEQGRILVLPIKPGDPYWLVEQQFLRSSEAPDSLEVDPYKAVVRIKKVYAFTLEAVLYLITSGQWNHCAFASEEEAEASLR